METLFYLAKTGTIYAVLYSIYFLLFRNNTNFQANRIYLLLIAPFSFILPFINSNVQVTTQYQVTLPAIEIGTLTTQATDFNWENVLIYFYIAVSSVLLIVFLTNLFKTITTISTLKQGENKTIQPFSFFSFIHVPTSIEEKDRNAIILHEKVHSTQIHSLDIIIYEISKILLWWNPFLWMGLHSVKSNHEFIADKLASAKADKYSSVLVAQLLGVNCSVLANNFKSKQLIKKRIMMMKTKKSNRLSVLKYALVIPVVTLTFLATAQKDQVVPVADISKHRVAPVADISDVPDVTYRTPPAPVTRISPINPPAAPVPPARIAIRQNRGKVYDKVDVMPEFKGGTDALMKYMGNNVKYPEDAKKNNIQGNVFVSFVIDTQGKVKDVNVVRSANELLDKEAVRVVKSMPNWKAGKKDGKKVNVKFTLPVSFKLKR